MASEVISLYKKRHYNQVENLPHIAMSAIKSLKRPAYFKGYTKIINIQNYDIVRNDSFSTFINFRRKCITIQKQKIIENEKAKCQLDRQATAVKRNLRPIQPHIKQFPIELKHDKVYLIVPNGFQSPECNFIDINVTISSKLAECTCDVVKKYSISEKRIHFLVKNKEVQTLIDEEQIQNEKSKNEEHLEEKTTRIAMIMEITNTDILICPVNDTHIKFKEGMRQVVIEEGAKSKKIDLFGAFCRILSIIREESLQQFQVPYSFLMPISYTD